MWGGAIKNLEASHSHVFNEDPDLPGGESASRIGACRHLDIHLAGLKSLFYSNTFNLRADWGKSEYTTRLGALTRFLTGTSLLPYPRCWR